MIYTPAVDEVFPRRTNQNGIDIIKEFEGLRLTAYLCPSDVWTIGYGHTRTACEGMRITESQADVLLDEDLRLFERAVVRLVQVPLNENQFSALVSFTFNVGAGNLEKSKLLFLLNRGWYDQVPFQMRQWNHAKGEVLGGLTRRRVAESNLWGLFC